jgi:hypothetical protein
MLLGEAGYGIGPFSGIEDPKTDAALREFQKNNELPVNGDALDMDLVDKLNEFGGLHDPLQLPPRVSSSFESWEEGFIRVTGTWVGVNDTIGTPVQTSEITCFKSMDICIEAQAKVFDSLLQVSTEFFDIDRWDDKEIVTKPSDKICVRSVTRINRLQKSVTALDSKISDKGLCKDAPAKDLVYVLDDGFSVYWKLHQEYLQRRNRVFKFTPDVLKSLSADGEKK